MGQPEEGSEAVSGRSRWRITKAKLSLCSWGGWESRSLLARRCGRPGCVPEDWMLGEHVHREARPRCSSGHFVLEKPLGEKGKDPGKGERQEEPRTVLFQKAFWVMRGRREGEAESANT